MLQNLRSIFTPFSSLKLFLLLLPFAIITGAYIAYQQAPLLLVHPHKGQLRKLITFDDTKQQGKSRVEVTQNQSNKLSYKYTISNAFLNPYAGVEYDSGKRKFFDLSAYDYIRFKIKASQGKRINFSLFTDINPAISEDMDKPHIYRPLTTILETDNQYRELNIPIKKLVTPDWWYIEAKIAKEEITLPDYSKVRYIVLGNCINISPGIEDIVDLEEIGFYKDFTSFYIFSALGIVFYFGIVGLLLYKKPKGVDVYFQHGKFTSTIPLSKAEETVFGYITSNYMNKELSIADIQKECGYSENKIADIIKTKTGLNFKAFLNKLRIAESKRLLLETDFNISEIAMKVGYGNVTHFNRVFKQSEGNSPNDYKKATFLQEEKTERA